MNGVDVRKNRGSTCVRPLVWARRRPFASIFLPGRTLSLADDMLLSPSNELSSFPRQNQFHPIRSPE
tara:strand:+ start:582 stop:782 length:201 start_codon:yes stop_codon:yes gene_type:complete